MNIVGRGIIEPAIFTVGYQTASLDLVKEGLKQIPGHIRDLLFSGNREPSEFSQPLMLTSGQEIKFGGTDWATIRGFIESPDIRNVLLEDLGMSVLGFVNQSTSVEGLVVAAVAQRVLMHVTNAHFKDSWLPAKSFQRILVGGTSVAVANACGFDANLPLVMLCGGISDLACSIF